MTSQNFLGRILAVAGFVAIIILLVWLAVRLVALMPPAFASLASIANSIYGDRSTSEIVVANDNSIINTGESFTIQWTDLGRTGNYIFTYECTDGVALDMRLPSSQAVSISCGEPIELVEGTTELEIIARSQMRRFVDIPYTIGFKPTNATVVASETSSRFTIVNALIPQGQNVAVTEPDGEVAGETTTEPVVTEPETPVTTPVTPVEPTFIETEILEIPVSDPDGFVDLAVTYLGVGRLTDSNRFIAGGTIDNDTRGAFQFEVRNIGTKTSDDWTFDATLTSGAIFTSDEQDGLLPNERSVITLGFDTVGETGAQRFGAEISVADDINRNNDDFSWAVSVTE